MEEQTSNKVGAFVSLAVNRILNLIMILVIIVLVVLVAYFWHNNQLLEQKVKGLQDEVEKMEKINLSSEDRDVVVRENGEKDSDEKMLSVDPAEQFNFDEYEGDKYSSYEWTSYKNNKLGIFFEYPKNLGNVTNFKNQETVFVFSEDKQGSMLGGHSNDYWNKTKSPEHGFNTHITCTGFDSQSIKSVWLGSLDLKADDRKGNGRYKISSNGNCAYTTNYIGYSTINTTLENPEGLIYHAICNLKSSEMSGFNIMFGNDQKPPKISKKDFIKMIESVKIY